MINALGKFQGGTPLFSKTISWLTPRPMSWMSPILAPAERNEIVETPHRRSVATKILCWMILMTSTRGTGDGELFQLASLVGRNVVGNRMRLRAGAMARSSSQLVDRGRREERKLWRRKMHPSLSHLILPILFAKVVRLVKSGRLEGPSTRLVPTAIGYNRLWSKGSGPSTRWCVSTFTIFSTH